MTKPKILVTSAAGRTGAPKVMELLANGYPVRAFVRRRDARAEALERAGAELFIGDMFDYRDVSPEERRRNADELPKARLITLQQTGHFAALERPRQITDVIVGSRERTIAAVA